MVKKSRALVQRKNHNDDLINRMRQGDSLQGQTAVDSWFPPRPVIKKNSAALKELYKTNHVQLADEDLEENQQHTGKHRHLKLA